MGVTVAVDRVACNTSTGNQAITVSAGGLTPKAALFILVGATTDGTAAADAVISYGAATGTANRWVVGGFSDDNLATTQTQSWYATDECIQVYDDATTLICEADFVSFAANTVTINWATAPSSAWLLTVVSFSGSDVSAHANIFDIGDVLETDSPPNDVDVTDPGFEPDVLFTASNVGLFNPGTSTFWETSVGLVHNDGAGTITQRAIVWNEQDARDTSVLAARNEDSGGIVETASVSNSSLDFYAGFGNFDVSGFSAGAYNAGGNSREICYLALSFGGAVSSWVGSYATPTATGSDSDTGPGFKPQFLFFIQNALETIDTGSTGSSSSSRGFSAITADAQYANSFTAEDGVGTSNTESKSDDVAIELPDEDGSSHLTATLTSFDTNGWTVNYSAVDIASKLFFALAIEDGGEIVSPLSVDISPDANYVQIV